MNNDIAVFLDTDNLAIGAKQANIHFDIRPILEHIKEITNGRIVIRRAYADWRHVPRLAEALTTQGFVLQSTVRIRNLTKNLADMQMIVDAMDTLIDSQNIGTYVLLTGDRDFTPLVQTLRKRGKHVIGYGVRHTSSRSLVNLCDQYIYYETLPKYKGDFRPSRTPTKPKKSDTSPAESANIITPKEQAKLLQDALNSLLQEKQRVRASLLKQHMQDANSNAFNTGKKEAFNTFLARHDNVVALERENSTLYVTHAENGETEDSTTEASDEKKAKQDTEKQETTDSSEAPPAVVAPPPRSTPSPTQKEDELASRYRRNLKKRSLRVVPPKVRLILIRDLLALLQKNEDIQWRQAIDLLVEQHKNSTESDGISRNIVNAVMLVARRAEIIYAAKEKSLATATLTLQLESNKIYQEAVMSCDAAYLREISMLKEPFSLEAAAIALYDTPQRARYLKVVHSRYNSSLNGSNNGASAIPDETDNA